MWWSSGSGTSRLIGSIRYQAGVQRSVIWFKELVITWGQYLNHSEGESSRSECSGCFTRQPAQLSSSTPCARLFFCVFNVCPSCLPCVLLLFQFKMSFWGLTSGELKMCFNEWKIKWNSKLNVESKNDFCKSVLMMCSVKQKSVLLNGSNQQLLSVGIPDQHF